MSPNGRSHRPGNDRLLRELQRWKPRRRRALSACRWLTWFASWMEARRRITPPLRSPAMALVQPIAWVQRLRERWFLRALQILPRIELTIRPMLQETSARQTVLRELASYPFAFPFSKPVLRGELGTRRFSDTPPDEYPASDAGTMRRQDGIWGNLKNSACLPEMFGFSPLELVLQRMSMPLAFVTRHEVNHASSRGLITLCERVVKKLQRSEQYIGRPNLVPPRPQPKLANAETTSPGSVAQSAELFEAASTRNRWKQPPPQPPPVNVDALTDQVLQRIDRRVVAWRERTGRR